MRFELAMLAACLMMSANAVWADAGKTVTLKGRLECGKCELKEAENCQNVLAVKGDDGKETKYYLTDNDISKKAHKEICTKPKENVTVTGTVTEKDGKEWLDASKIE